MDVLLSCDVPVWMLPGLFFRVSCAACLLNTRTTKMVFDMAKSTIPIANARVTNGVLPCTMIEYDAEEDETEAESLVFSAVCGEPGTGDLCFDYVLPAVVFLWDIRELHDVQIDIGSESKLPSQVYDAISKMMKQDLTRWLLQYCNSSQRKTVLTTVPAIKHLRLHGYGYGSGFLSLINLSESESELQDSSFRYEFTWLRLREGFFYIDQ
jgi:hypothetical protein